MAIKTFTANEVLTASDTNTYLNNGGLVYVTQSSFAGTGLNIDNCFTTTFDNYRIVIAGLGANGVGGFAIQMRASGATPAQGWQYAYRGLYTNGTTEDLAVPTDTSAEVGLYIGVANTQIAHAVIDITSPKLAQRTFMSSNAFSYAGSYFFTRNGGGVLDSNSQYDGIRLFTKGATPATFTSGVATVFGYRKS